MHFILYWCALHTFYFGGMYNTPKNGMLSVRRDFIPKKYVMHTFVLTVQAYILHDRAGTLASLLYKAESPSVRLHFLSRDNLGCLCTDRREIWFVYSCGLWHVNAPLNNFLTVLCWAHERFKHIAVVVFAIIFGRVKY